MARIRTVKPEFWSSEQVCNCSITSRLLFIGMWNFADDSGIHPASTKRLKMEVLPGDAITDWEVRSCVDELIREGLIIEYEAQDKKWWQVTGWNHQRIIKPTFKYPSMNGSAPVAHQSDTSSPRMYMGNCKGIKKKNTKKKKASVPEGYPPEFEEFWTAYPRREGKGNAWAAWGKALPVAAKSPKRAADETVEQFLARRANDYAAFMSTREAQFIRLPATWLNGGNWDDETGSRVASAEDLANWRPE